MDTPELRVSDKLAGMIYIHVAYFLITIVESVAILLQDHAGAAISLLVGSLFGWAGGVGARGSFDGTWDQKFVSLALALVVSGLGALIANWGHSTVWLWIDGSPAGLWVFIGTVIGFIFTRQKPARA
jgi:hypothetical protein